MLGVLLTWQQAGDPGWPGVPRVRRSAYTIAGLTAIGWGTETLHTTTCWKLSLEIACLDLAADGHYIWCP